MSRRTRPVDPDAQPGTTEEIVVLASHNPDAVHEAFRPDDIQAIEDELHALSYPVNGRIFYCGNGSLDSQQGKYSDPQYHEKYATSVHLTKIVARSGCYTTADVLIDGEVTPEASILLCFEAPQGHYRIKASDTDRLEALEEFRGTRPKLPP
jgi:hypothetical protein